LSEFDFDKIIDRRNRRSEKWDYYGDRDIIPMWVADMDFQSPPAVINALHDDIEHGVFGYAAPTKGLVNVTLTMLKKNYNWDVKEEWLVWLPGLVSGLSVSCRCVGEKGDGIVTTTPIYPPFLMVPNQSDRTCIKVPMVQTDEYWTIDFDAFEKAIAQNVKVFLLCNPNNPTGRIFTKEELTKISEICIKHDVIVCSDEIHCELLLEDTPHIPTATLNEAALQNTITLMAPSKTYNVAGLGCSFAIIANKKLRHKFQRTAKGIVPPVNTVAFTACEASYQHGEPWRDALIAYLKENRNIISTFVQEHLSPLKVCHVEATYLAWINASELGIKDPTKFFEDHGVGLSNGAFFDMPEYVRLNFGCTKATLLEGLNRMKKAIESLK